MRIYIIYQNLDEYPGKIVVYGYTLKIDELSRDPKPLTVVDTIREARAAIPRTYNYRCPRHPTDDPHTIESWL
jgi:hypothetical protein